jgi:hypothetical protein
MVATFRQFVGYLAARCAATMLDRWPRLCRLRFALLYRQSNSILPSQIRGLPVAPD